MISPASAFSFALILLRAAARPGRVAITSTSASLIFLATFWSIVLEGAITVSSTLASPSWTPVTFGSSLSTMGARMKIALNGSREVLRSFPSAFCKNGRSRLASKLSICRPKWFRLTRTLSPPMSSWPPFLVRFADSASSIRPAHVPHVGFLKTLGGYEHKYFQHIRMTHLTKSLRGSNMFDLWATNDIAVLSPPGIMRASHDFSSPSVRTSLNVQLLSTMSFDARIWAACRSSWTCSLNAPCKANTPTVTSTAGSFEPITSIFRAEILFQRINTCPKFLTCDVVFEKPCQSSGQP